MEKAAAMAFVIVGTGYGGWWLCSALKKALRPDLSPAERRMALGAAMVPVVALGVLALQNVAMR